MQERPGAVGAGPEEGYKTDQRAGAPLLEERLREVGFLSLENRKLQGDLTVAFQNLKGVYKKDGDRLFSRVCSDSTRGSGFQLKEGQPRLDIRKTFVTTEVVKHWHRFPREAVGAPSLETLKARLDGALSNLI